MTGSNFQDDRHTIHCGYILGLMSRPGSGFDVTPIPDDDGNWTPDFDLQVGHGSERRTVRFRILPEDAT